MVQQPYDIICHVFDGVRIRRSVGKWDIVWVSLFGVGLGLGLGVGLGIWIGIGLGLGLGLGFGIGLGLGSSAMSSMVYANEGPSGSGM